MKVEDIFDVFAPCLDLSKKIECTVCSTNLQGLENIKQTSTELRLRLPSLPGNEHGRCSSRQVVGWLIAAAWQKSVATCGDIWLMDLKRSLLVLSSYHWSYHPIIGPIIDPIILWQVHHIPFFGFLFGTSCFLNILLLGWGTVFRPPFLFQVPDDGRGTGLQSLPRHLTGVQGAEPWPADRRRQRQDRGEADQRSHGGLAWYRWCFQNWATMGIDGIDMPLEMN